MGSVGTDDKFVMMDRVEDQLWELWIRVQWGMAYGMGQWMARCQVVECESSCWSGWQGVVDQGPVGHGLWDGSVDGKVPGG